METAATIWMYWENPANDTKPAWLELCAETIERHRGRLELRVVTPEDVRALIPDLRDEWWSLRKIAHRADYLRSRLLLRYGGIWLDADVIALASLEQLADALDEHEFVAYGLERGRAESGFLAARPGTDLVAEWSAAQDRALDGLGASGALGWTELGHDPLQAALARCPHGNIPAQAIAPISWDQWKRFLSPFQPGRTVVNDSTLLVMLYNEVMGPELSRWSRSRLLTSPTLLSRLFRRALDLPGSLEPASAQRFGVPISRLWWSEPAWLVRRAGRSALYRTRRTSRHLSARLRLER